MSLETMCKACDEELDMRHGSCPACWWRAHKRVPELEAINAELLEALEHIASQCNKTDKVPQFLFTINQITTEAISKAKGD